MFLKQASPLFLQDKEKGPPCLYIYTHVLSDCDTLCMAKPWQTARPKPRRTSASSTQGPRFFVRCGYCASGKEMVRGTYFTKERSLPNIQVRACFAETGTMSAFAQKGQVRTQPRSRYPGYVPFYAPAITVVCGG